MINVRLLKICSLRHNVFVGIVVAFVVLFSFFFILEKIAVLPLIIHRELLIQTNDYVIGLVFAIIVFIGTFFLPYKEKGIFALAWLLRIGIVFVFMLLFEGHYEQLDSFLFYYTSVYTPTHTLVPLNATCGPAARCIL